MSVNVIVLAHILKTNLTRGRITKALSDFAYYNRRTRRAPYSRLVDDTGVLFTFNKAPKTSARVVQGISAGNTRAYILSAEV